MATLFTRCYTYVAHRNVIMCVSTMFVKTAKNTYSYTHTDELCVSVYMCVCVCVTVLVCVCVCVCVCVQCGNK